MQIREIVKHNVSEGIIDTFKTAANWGSGETWSQAKSRVKADSAAGALLKKALPAWDNYAKRLKAMTPDPARYKQLYQQSLAAFVQKNLLGNQPIDSAINRREITQLISSITDNADNPQQLSSQFAKLIQQAGLSQQDTSRGVVLAKVVSTNPTVIQYRNINYAQNQEGNWANQQTGRVPDESFQAFLDQEATKAGA